MPRSIQDDDDNIVRDGERYRVPLQFMDGSLAGRAHKAIAEMRNIHDGQRRQAGFRPGYCFSDDTAQEQERARLWEQRSEYLRTAWMNPTINKPAGLKPFEPLPPITKRQPLDDPEKAAREAWEERGRQQREAWRGTA